jgi:hypothetical protein
MRAETVVVFDDYYVDAPPALREKGCNALVDGMDRSLYTVRILDPEDAFPKPWGVLRIRMVEVRLRTGREKASRRAPAGGGARPSPR